MSFESFDQLPFQDVIPSYLYQQYADDSDLQAFIQAYNQLTQDYLDWYNQTPLSVYTSMNVTGLLLDWVGKGLYGLDRPVIATSSSSTTGFYLSAPFASRIPYGMLRTVSSGTTVIANDDIYKRSLTWNLYAGDGYQSSIIWLRKRIARFLYGTNGTDISVDDLLNVDIQYQVTYKAISYAGKAPYMTMTPYMTTTIRSSYAELIITIPNTPISQTFKTLFDGGILQVPFQMNYTVTLA